MYNHLHQSTQPKKTIAVIGGGASALSFASFIDTNKYDVTIYEKNNALARKFLVAGNGGFNLTHSENTAEFIQRYTPAEFIAPFIKQFTNTDFRNWLSSIGIETYVGTSKRVFPKKGIKPIEVLKAIESVIKKNNVSMAYNHEWLGWKNEALLFNHEQKQITIKAAIYVFALGGASWKITGSNDKWLHYFETKHIHTIPFQASNAAFGIAWDKQLLPLIEGKALKNAMFSINAFSKKGEAVLTAFGIEGSGVYPLSSEIRKQLQTTGEPIVTIDFKPDLTIEEIKDRLETHSHLSMKDILEKKLNLTNIHIALIKQRTSKSEYQSAPYISQLIKAFPITIISLAPINEAISTVGGIDLKEVTVNLEFKKLPHHYCLGEMLDWDAPTGGYLLQACMSMGNNLANYLNTIA